MTDEAGKQIASIAAVQASNIDSTGHVDHRLRHRRTVGIVQSCQSRLVQRFDHWFFNGLLDGPVSGGLRCADLLRWRPATTLQTVRSRKGRNYVSVAQTELKEVLRSPQSHRGREISWPVSDSHSRSDLAFTLRPNAPPLRDDRLL